MGAANKYMDHRQILDATADSRAMGFGLQRFLGVRNHTLGFQGRFATAERRLHTLSQKVRKSTSIHPGARYHSRCSCRPVSCRFRPPQHQISLCKEAITISGHRYWTGCSHREVGHEDRCQACLAHLWGVKHAGEDLRISHFVPPYPNDPLCGRGLLQVQVLLPSFLCPCPLQSVPAHHVS